MDKKDEMIFRNLCICFFMVLITISILNVNSQPMYVQNEEIVYKDISHISPYDFTHYNIYTERNKFEVELSDYNEMKVKDNLTVVYNNGSIVPYTRYNNKEYFSDN